MNCSISSGIYACNNFSIGGIKRLFVANRSGFDGFIYETGDTFFTTVTSIVEDSEFDGWFEINTFPQSSFFTQNRILGKNRDIYKMALDITIPEMTPNKRNRLLELAAGRFLIVFQDKNNRWYIMGLESYGAKVTNIDLTTGTIEELNSIRMLFQNEGKYPIKFIDSDYVEANIIPATILYTECGCTQLIDENLSVNAQCELIDLVSCPLS